jgi:carbonic anhydrase
MTKVLNEVLAANARYAEDFGDRSELPIPPARRFAILTCMDAALIRPSSPGSPRATPT